MNENDEMHRHSMLLETEPTNGLDVALHPLPAQNPMYLNRNPVILLMISIVVLTRPNKIFLGHVTTVFELVIGREVRVKFLSQSLESELDTRAHRCNVVLIKNALINTNRTYLLSRT